MELSKVRSVIFISAPQNPLCIQLPAAYVFLTLKSFASIVPRSVIGLPLRHLILPESSHHPTFTHRGVLYSQVLRWAVLCTSKEDFQRACAKVFPVWRNQGVTRSALRFAFNRVNITTGLSDSWRAGFHKYATALAAELVL